MSQRRWLVQVERRVWIYKQFWRTLGFIACRGSRRRRSHTAPSGLQLVPGDRKNCPKQKGCHEGAGEKCQSLLGMGEVGRVQVPVEGWSFDGKDCVSTVAGETWTGVGTWSLWA